MKLICNGSDLSDALSKVIKALPIRKMSPILECVKLSAYEDVLTLTATDIDFTIIKKIKADIIMEGEALVYGHLFGDITRTLVDKEEIEINDFKENSVTLNYGDNSSVIVCGKLEEYPPIETFESNTQIVMTQKDLKELIDGTIFSAANDEIRPLYKGVDVRIEDDKITFVALDGHRLAVCTRTLEKKACVNDFIVPAKSLSEITKILENSDKSVLLDIGSKKLRVDMGDIEVITTLLNGTFMDYTATLPDFFDTVITVDKKQLEGSLERVSVMPRYDKSNSVRLDITEGMMVIYASGTLGQSTETLTPFTKGKDLKVRFNAKYIAECLKNISDECVLMQFSSQKNHCVIKPVEGDNYTYLILPIGREK